MHQIYHRFSVDLGLILERDRCETRELREFGWRVGVAIADVRFTPLAASPGSRALGPCV